MQSRRPPRIPNRLPGAYEKLQEAQARVEELYARWAELESGLLGGQP